MSKSAAALKVTLGAPADEIGQELVIPWGKVRTFTFPGNSGSISQVDFTLLNSLREFINVIFSGQQVDGVTVVRLNSDPTVLMIEVDNRIVSSDGGFLEVSFETVAGFITIDPQITLEGPPGPIE